MKKHSVEKIILPENPTWEELLDLVGQLIEEVNGYRTQSGWGMEVLHQARCQIIFWRVMWLITLAVLVGSNAAWIYVCR